jgi:hypothetical protein
MAWKHACEPRSGLKTKSNNLRSSKRRPDCRKKTVSDAVDFRAVQQFLGGGFAMIRFSFGFVAALALLAAATSSISPARALSGAAYEKCMAKCMKNSPKGNRCPEWCDKFGNR